MNDSFIETFTDNGSVIITPKPVEHPQVNGPNFEDNLHVIVGCSLALILVTLLGLFVRHHGLTLNTANSQLPHTASMNTEDQTRLYGKEGVSGLGISVRVPPAARVK